MTSTSGWSSTMGRCSAPAGTSTNRGADPAGLARLSANDKARRDGQAYGGSASPPSRATTQRPSALALARRKTLVRLSL